MVCYLQLLKPEFRDFVQQIPVAWQGLLELGRPGSVFAEQFARLGLALFALDKPAVCLARGDSWMFGPEVGYECHGDVGKVAFPCGYTIGADGDTIRLYYGAADTCIALATGSLRELLGWLTGNGQAC